ncbi:MAG: DUF2180 family protein [Ktedonobacteraceae bacterium]|nr:DUF2180 family protein [Ktedonobacteraceae bacterium]
MNCYLCYLETGYTSRTALACCHTCGAGMCEQHLIAVITQRMSGMAGPGMQGRRLLCTRCYADATPEARPSTVRRQRPQRPWWQRFRQPKQPILPQPEEAVALVERFLKHQQQEKPEK